MCFCKMLIYAGLPLVQRSTVLPIFVNKSARIRIVCISTNQARIWIRTPAKTCPPYSTLQKQQKGCTQMPLLHTTCVGNLQDRTPQALQIKMMAQWPCQQLHHGRPCPNHQKPPLLRKRQARPRAAIKSIRSRIPCLHLRLVATTVRDRYHHRPAKQVRDRFILPNCSHLLSSPVLIIQSWERR